MSIRCHICNGLAPRGIDYYDPSRPGSGPWTWYVGCPACHFPGEPTSEHELDRRLRRLGLRRVEEDQPTEMDYLV